MLERHHENSQCRLMTMPRVPGVEAMGGPQPVPALRVRNLHKSYGSVDVLRGISLDIAQGSVVTLIGSSGSGKSTFLRCLNHLEQPTSGEIYIDGEPMGFRLDANGASRPDAAHVTRMSTRRGCRAGSSSGLRLRGRWPWSQRSCCSMRPPPRLIPS